MDGKAVCNERIRTLSGHAAVTLQKQKLLHVLFRLSHLHRTTKRDYILDMQTKSTHFKLC